MLGRALSYWNSCCASMLDSHGLNSAIRLSPPAVPPYPMPMDCTPPPPLVVRPCSSPMHVIQGSSGLIRGIRAGWHLLLIGWLPDLVAHCHGCFFTLHGPAPGSWVSHVSVPRV